MECRARSENNPKVGENPKVGGFSLETLNVFDSSERTPICYALSVDEADRKDILLELMRHGKVVRLRLSPNSNAHLFLLTHAGCLYPISTRVDLSSEQTRMIAFVEGFMSEFDTAWTVMCNAVQHRDVGLIRELAMRKVAFPMVRRGAGARDIEHADTEDDKPNHARNISSSPATLVARDSQVIMKSNGSLHPTKFCGQSFDGVN